MGIEVGAMQVRLANRAESSLAERSRFVQLTEQFYQDGFSRLCIEAGLQFDAEGRQDHQTG